MSSPSPFLSLCKTCGQFLCQPCRSLPHLRSHGQPPIHMLISLRVRQAPLSFARIFSLIHFSATPLLYRPLVLSLIYYYSRSFRLPLPLYVSLLRLCPASSESIVPRLHHRSYVASSLFLLLEIYMSAPISRSYLALPASFSLFQTPVGVSRPSVSNDHLLWSMLSYDVRCSLSLPASLFRTFDQPHPYSPADSDLHDCTIPGLNHHTSDVIQRELAVDDLLCWPLSLLFDQLFPHSTNHFYDVLRTLCQLLPPFHRCEPALRHRVLTSRTRYVTQTPLLPASMLPPFEHFLNILLSASFHRCFTTLLSLAAPFSPEPHSL